MTHAHPLDLVGARCGGVARGAARAYHIVALVALAVALSACATVEVPPLETMQALDYGHGESFVQVGEEQLCVVERGRRDAGETLIFLHPWGGNIGWWRDVVPRFDERYRVIVIDLPGHGKSTKGRGHYDLPRAEAAVVGVMDALGVERATLIGNSMGGGVALALTHDHPARVERLVLVDALGSGDVPGVFGFFTDAFFEAPLLLGVDDGLMQLGIELFAFDAMGAASDALVSEMLAVRRSADGYAWALAVSSYLRNIIGFDGSGWLAEITAPTLIVWGDSDWILWPWSADSFHEGIAGSQLVVIEDCGHMPELERPDELADAIVGFLAGAAVGEPVRAATHIASPR